MVIAGQITEDTDLESKTTTTSGTSTTSKFRRHTQYQPPCGWVRHLKEITIWDTEHSHDLITCTTPTGKIADLQLETTMKLHTLEDPRPLLIATLLPAHLK
jgi:hypothetical protein